MRLDEIKFFKDTYNEKFSDVLAKFVKEKGLSKASGNQAQVIWVEGKSWIWRAWFNDDGYERFLKYVSSHSSNPHLPKILSKIREESVQFKGMPKDMKIKYVKLEKLTEMDPSVFTDAIDVFDGVGKPFTSVEAYIKALENGEVKIPADSDSEIEEVVAEINKHPKFFQTVIDLKKIGSNDLNHGNVMMRGDIAVITDPISEN